MELSDRKKKILRAIVDLYIRTAEPVASKTIAQMPDMDFSSATIRNEMAELTTLGYLEQPHTSAGRIPSPAGYRLYVDELMQDYRLSTDETKSIDQAMELKMQEVDKVVSQVGKLVSQMTNLPAYAMAARAAGLTVRRFDLILADSGSFILVVMLSDSSVENKLIRLPVELTEADLEASRRSAERKRHGADPPNSSQPRASVPRDQKLRKCGQPRARHHGFRHVASAPGAQRGLHDRAGQASRPAEYITTSGGRGTLRASTRMWFPIFPPHFPRTAGRRSWSARKTCRRSCATPASS